MGQRFDDQTTQNLDAPDPDGGDHLSLMVFTEHGVATHALPASGTVTVGRAEQCDVRVDDASVSRQHLAVHLGGPYLTVEDLGSANGTRVRSSPLVPRTRVAVTPGETIELGAVLVLLGTRTLAPSQHRRIWPHDYFEGRVEEECARAERAGTPFAVLRIRCHGGAARNDLQRLLAEAASSPDVLGAYGPEEYELLAVGVTRAQAEAARDRLAGLLARHGVTAAFGLACYPDDGRGPDALIARATTSPAPSAAAGLAREGLAMEALRRLVARVATGDISVLILGETGVGKEVVAETVHRLSSRAGKPLLRLSCAALSESLLESELFGHERGAFTGATCAKPGLLETAQGGTVLLDEIGELPLTTQVKLLRVLEERKVLRVGSVTARTIDVRFLAATNRNLEAQIERGRFRPDLYYRLNGVTLLVPPLRERVSEIAGLARGFLREAARRAGREHPLELSGEVLRVLEGYGWPGNVRELRNVMERAALLCGDGPLTVEHLPLGKMRSTYVMSPPAPRAERLAPDESGTTPPLTRPPLAAARPDAPAGAAGPGSVPPAGAPRPAERAPATVDEDEAERRRIMASLAECAGNQKRAAERLGISRRTLINRLIALGIPRPRKAGDGP